MFEHRYERNERREQCGCIPGHRHLTMWRPCNRKLRGVCTEQQRPGQLEQRKQKWKWEMWSEWEWGNRLCMALEANVGFRILHLRKMGAIVGFWAEEQHKSWVLKRSLWPLSWGQTNVGISGSGETSQAFSWADGIATKVGALVEF